MRRKRALTAVERRGINAALILAVVDEWGCQIQPLRCLRCGSPLAVWFERGKRWTKDPFCILCHNHTRAHQLYLLAKRLLIDRLSVVRGH